MAHLRAQYIEHTLVGGKNKMDGVLLGKQEKKRAGVCCYKKRSIMGRRFCIISDLLPVYIASSYLYMHHKCIICSFQFHSCSFLFWFFGFTFCRLHYNTLAGYYKFTRDPHECTRGIIISFLFSRLMIFFELSIWMDDFTCAGHHYTSTWTIPHKLWSQNLTTHTHHNERAGIYNERRDDDQGRSEYDVQSLGNRIYSIRSN